MSECELTHFQRETIDVARAERQHRAYERALESAGCRIVQAPALPDLPDSVFVEDTAVVLDELAIITRPGADSRKPETASMAETLAPLRPIFRIEAPGTLDGGDVLRIGKRLWVGLSSRSNAAALEQMQRILAPHGYTVVGVVCKACLHLKSAVTQVGPDLLLLNPDWVDASIFSDFRIVETDPEEPGAANALFVNDLLVFPADFPRTLQRLRDAGARVLPVENSEVIKAEGGVTCCSILLS